MDKIVRFIIIIFSVVVVWNLDEHALFPFILNYVLSPFDWLLVVVISVGELVLLVKEAELLFRG
jgi:hypothetical protein